MRPVGRHGMRPVHGARRTHGPRRIARRSEAMRRRAGARPASSAAVKAASSPSRTARRAPPTPVASPATYTPGCELRCRSSTQATREPSTSSRVSAPAARTSSSDGVKPQPSPTRSTASSRSVPATGRPCRSTRAMVTASTASSPWIRMIAVRGRYGMRRRSSAAAYPAPSTSLDGAPRMPRGAAEPRARRPGLADRDHLDPGGGEAGRHRKQERAGAGDDRAAARRPRRGP